MAVDRPFLRHVVNTVLLLGISGHPCLASGSGEIVDEPIGLDYSTGLTLWHMGRNPVMIRRFHSFLDKKGIKPEDILSKSELRPPDATRRILLDPGFLTSEQIKVSKGTIPLAIDRAGLYRVWVRGRANLTIYRIKGKTRQTIVEGAIYRRGQSNQGDWNELWVDFEVGNYQVRVGGWAGIYVTDELWADRPSDEMLEALRKSASQQGA